MRLDLFGKLSTAVVTNEFYECIVNRLDPADKIARPSQYGNSRRRLLLRKGRGVESENCKRNAQHLAHVGS